MDEIVYNLLIENGPMTTEQIAPHLGLDLRLTRKHMERLERVGEVRRIADDESKFFDQTWGVA